MDFAQELSALFAPDKEEIPPYFVHTLLESEDPRFQHEERTVDPSVAIIWLLAEPTHVLSIKLEITEAGWCTYCGYGGNLTVGPMKCEKAFKINI